MVASQAQTLGSFLPLAWPWSPAAPTQQQQEAAYQMTNLKVWAKQLTINRSKLNAARAAGAGGLREYAEASHEQRVAEQQFDIANAMAIDAYNAAARAGKVRPLDAEGNTGLSGAAAVLTIVLGVALVVAGFIVAAPFLAVCGAVVVALGAFTLAINALSRVSPQVGKALSDTAGSAAMIVLAVVGFLAFSKLKGGA